MTAETKETWILVGVWVEVALGLFLTWLGWMGLQDRRRQRIKRLVSRTLRHLGMQAGHR